MNNEKSNLPEEEGKSFLDKVKDGFENLKDKAEDVWDKVEDKAEDLWDATKEKAKDIKDKIADRFDSDEEEEKKDPAP